MKKFWLIVCTLVSCLCLSLALTACDFGNGSGNSKDHTHSFTDYIYNDDATCEKDGTETATCTCGKTDTRTKPDTALGHDLKHFEKKDATCLESGHEAYDACNRAGCGYSTYREIKPLGHSFENYIYNNDATCTEDGTETAKCSRCEATDIRVKEDSALGHEMSFHAQTATCTEDGARAYWSCATCKKNFAEREGDTELSSVEMNALGHEFTAENRCVRYDECGETWEFSDGLTYRQEGSAYTVTGIGTASGDIVIPFGHEGKFVTKIGSEAFKGTSITSVTIPECIEWVGHDAFSQCASLERVYWNAVHGSADTGYSFVAGAGRSSDCAFFECNRLTDFYIGENVELFKGSYLSACYALERLHCAGGNERFRVIENCLIDTVDKILVAGLDSVAQEGYTVVGSFAFTPRRLQGDVVIPEGVTSIEEYAFGGCYSLVSVTLPTTPIEIGDHAFLACQGLERVENSTNVTKLKACSFQFCESLKNFTFGSQIEEIREYSFEGCASLESIVLPDNITRLRHDVFSGCTSVKSISIGSGILSLVEDIGGGDYYTIFTGCATSLEHIAVSSNNPVLFVDGNCLIGYDYYFDYETQQYVTDKTKQTLYLGCADSVIPEGVTKIMASAFEGSALTNVTLPQTVSEIGSSTFKDTQISEIIIPVGVAKIGGDAFMGTRLSEIVIPKNVTEIGACAFRNCEELVRVTILGGVTELPEGMFMGCIRLSSIEIPESVTRLGDAQLGYDDGVFEGCSSLSEIHLPDGIEEIGASTFRETAVEEFVCPEALTVIGEDAFFDCALLHSITLNRNLEKIGDYAFANCVRLFEIWNYSQLPVEDCKGGWNFDSVHFGGIANNVKYIYHGDEPSKRYEDENGFVFMENEDSSIVLVQYRGEGTVLVFPETDPNGKPYSVDSHIYYANSQQIEKVVFPEGLTQLENVWSGSGLENLKIVEWNARNFTTSDYAFFGPELDEFIVGENVQVLPAALETVRAKRLTWNAINAEFGSRSSGVPARFVYISKVNFGDKVQVIPNSLFENNEHLTHVEFPENITLIGQNAFIQCDKLETVTFHGGQVEIGLDAFYGCDALANLTLTGVKTIGRSAFSDCASLKTLVLPESLQEIADAAFFECLGLVEIWNKTSLPIVVGSDGYGYVAKYAFVVHTGDEASCLTTDKDGFVFYEDDEHACLVDYTGNATDLILPETSPQGKQYELRANALRGDFASVDTGDGVVSIGRHAFSGTIQKITIGKNVKSIDCDAIASFGLQILIWNAEAAAVTGTVSLFQSQNDLSEVVFGNGVKVIPQNFMTRCYNVRSLNFPDGVTTIGSRAFIAMYRLSRIILGRNVSTIETGAFDSCPVLVEIWNHSSLVLTCGDRSENGSIAWHAKAIYLGDEPSSQVEKDGFLFYEDENGSLLLTYLGDDEIVTFPRLSPSGRQYSIPEGSFNDCSFREIVLSNQIEEIGFSAFYGCYLSKIYFIGTSAEWSELSGPASFSIYDGVYFFSSSVPTEEQWSENPYWWHYAEDGTTILLWTRNA